MLSRTIRRQRHGSLRSLIARRLPYCILQRATTNRRLRTCAGNVELDGASQPARRRCRSPKTPLLTGTGHTHVSWRWSKSENARTPENINKKLPVQNSGQVLPTNANRFLPPPRRANRAATGSRGQIIGPNSPARASTTRRNVTQTPRLPSQAQYPSRSRRRATPYRGAIDTALFICGRHLA